MLSNFALSAAMISSMLSDVMLSDIMLSDVILSIIMLSDAIVSVSASYLYVAATAFFVKRRRGKFAHVNAA
jgi:hypothetical protein